MNELPEDLRDYQSIKVEDSMQLRELHHYIKYIRYHLKEIYSNCCI
jgi:hypothetical protein